MTNAVRRLLVCSAGVLCGAVMLAGLMVSSPARADTVAVDNSVLLDPYSLGPSHHHGWRGGRGYFGDGYDGYYGERRESWGRDVAYVDCGGHRGFHSISEAVDHVAPYGEVRVLSGYDGAPCLETVLIGKPVRIVGDRRGAPVTVVSPPGQPCMLVRTEDTVVLRDIRFAGHGHDQPCIVLEEGWLIARDVDINSHGSDWAIDLGHGGGLAGAGLHIATDGSGINANGSHLHLSDLSIDMDHGPSVGMMLERTDGVIRGLAIKGGHVGAEASPGPDGLTLENVDISDTDRALRFRASAGGEITVQGFSIRHTGLGVSMGPDVRVTIAEGEITNTQWAAIAVYHGAPFVHEVHISDSLFRPVDRRRRRERRARRQSHRRHARSPHPLRFSGTGADRSQRAGVQQPRPLPDGRRRERDHPRRQHLHFSGRGSALRSRARCTGGAAAAATRPLTRVRPRLRVLP